MITACCIRLCSEDAWFTVKEADLGARNRIGAVGHWGKCEQVWRRMLAHCNGCRKLLAINR